MSRDELIRRAMMHIRNGYAVGGKPGESAMSRAEAERGVSSGNYGGQTARAEAGSSGGGGGGNVANNVGGIRDGGFGGTDMGQQRSNTAAKSDFGFAGQPSANLAAKGDFLTSSTNPLSNYVAPSPQAPANKASNLNIGDDAFARAMQIISASSPSRNTFPALTGTNVNAGQLQGFELSQPSPVNFNAAITGYGSGLPIQNPKTISDYMGIKTSAPPVNGPLAQQVNTAAKGDFLGIPTSRGLAVNNIAPASSFAGFGLPETPSTNMSNVVAGTQPSSYGIPVSDAASFYSSMPSPSSVAGLQNPSALASYMGSQMYNTGPRPQTITQSTPTEIGQRINNLKAMAANPNLTAAQKAKLSSEVLALEAMGGVSFSPTSEVRPVPEGFVVDPKTGVVSKSPGYNVVAGPYAEVPSPIGVFKNMSFAMPSKIALATQQTVPNPNYRQVPMDTQASLLSSGTNSVSPVLSQGPQNILSSNYQYDGTPANAAYKAPSAPQYAYDGTPANAAYKAPASPQYAYDGTPANAVYKAPTANQYAYDGTPANAVYNAGVAPPVQVAQQTASTPSVADAVANQNVINPVADVSPTMNYVPMVPRTPIAPPPDANIFQSIANAMLPENLFPNALYTQPTPPGQYLVQAPENRGVLSGYMSEPFRIDRDIGVATIPTTGMPNPNANVITTASGRQMAFNPARGQYEYVSRFDGSLDDRPGGDNREENRKNIENLQVRRLLAMGYSEEEIEEMSDDERQDLIRTSANGGRIQYRRGGRSERSETESSSSSTYKPLSLPAMPEYKPYTLPQYTMPSASPLISNFVGSLSQPIPPVQIPQYQSMVSPLQNVEASFANPAMGTAAGPTSGGVNALRYNPMLMDERPDYALTKNDSLSNALRLLKG